MSNGSSPLSHSFPVGTTLVYRMKCDMLFLSFMLLLEGMHTPMKLLLFSVPDTCSLFIAQSHNQLCVKVLICEFQRKVDILHMEYSIFFLTCANFLGEIS